MWIALVEDDIDQAALVRRWLESAGHRCDHFDHGRAFLDWASRGAFELAFIDWELPNTNGREIIRELRRQANNTLPIVLVTAHDGERQLSEALAVGANDYLTKPLRRLRLLATVEAFSTPATELTPFVFEPARLTVKRNNGEIQLKAVEYRACEILSEYVGQFVANDALLDELRVNGHQVDAFTLGGLMSRLRSRLELWPQNRHGWQLSSVLRLGYRLERVDEAE